MWRYLARRAIQTVITLLVVIVLLFVIFRLMPGDPSRFFIEPGQTPENIDRLKVEYGMAKSVPAEGTDYESAFDTLSLGSYSIRITATDTEGNKASLYAAHTRELDFPPGGPGIVNITARPFHIVNVSDEVILEAEPVGSSPKGVWVNITYPDNSSENLTLSPSAGARYNATFTPGQAGVYVMVFGVMAANDEVALAPYTMAANDAQEALAPFSLKDDHIWIESVLTGTRVIDQDRKRLHVSIVSSEAGGGLKSIENVTADIWKKEWKTKTKSFDNQTIVVDLLPLVHVDEVVPTTWWEQFVPYMQGMLTFNFGNSFFTRQPVIDEIGAKVGPTLLLFGSSLILSTLIGVSLGVLLAWYRGTKMEMSAIVVSLFFYSMPLFWFGLILLWAFAFKLGWFPINGMIDPEIWSPEPPPLLTQIWDIGRHLVLPLVTLMILGLAGAILLMRNSMLEVLGEDYITTAKAKGLTERQVMYKHAARNALLPVTTAVAIAAGSVISGGVLTETIYSWPGMGFYLVNRTLRQDYPAIQATFYILAILTILANWIADMLYAILDPRVRL